MTLDDRLLLARIASGNDEALHELYQGYAPHTPRQSQVMRYGGYSRGMDRAPHTDPYPQGIS